VESFHGRLRDKCLNTSWFWNLFNARRKIAAWQEAYSSTRLHSSLAYRTPNEFARQWKTASLSAREDRGVDQPHQGNPDGLCFASALTRLLFGPKNPFQEREVEKCAL
jgi:transposase InsO family protein